MDYKRFFTSEPIKDGLVILKDNEFYHASKVLRLKEGYKIIVNNNTNIDYYCEIDKIGKDYIWAKVEGEQLNDAYDDTDVTLNIGLCKEFDTVIQKSVEMGVKKVVPFISQHTNVKTINYDRINKIILESTKQCGRPNLMEIEPTISFAEAINTVDSFDSVLFFYEFERNNQIKDIDLSLKNKVSIFIGSEGGFSQEEIEKVLKKDINILTLGKRILRVQTAVVAALALCLQGMNKL